MELPGGAMLNAGFHFPLLKKASHQAVCMEPSVADQNRSTWYEVRAKLEGWVPAGAVPDPATGNSGTQFASFTKRSQNVDVNEPSCRPRNTSTCCAIRETVH